MSITFPNTMKNKWPWHKALFAVLAKTDFVLCMFKIYGQCAFQCTKMLAIMINQFYNYWHREKTCVIAPATYFIMSFALAPLPLRVCSLSSLQKYRRCYLPGCFISSRKCSWQKTAVNRPNLYSNLDDVITSRMYIIHYKLCWVERMKA